MLKCLVTTVILFNEGKNNIPLFLILPTKRLQCLSDFFGKGFTGTISVNCSLKLCSDSNFTYLFFNLKQQQHEWKSTLRVTTFIYLTLKSKVELTVKVKDLNVNFFMSYLEFFQKIQNLAIFALLIVIDLYKSPYITCPGNPW